MGILSLPFGNWQVRLKALCVMHCHWQTRPLHLVKGHLMMPLSMQCLVLLTLPTWYDWSQIFITMTKPLLPRILSKCARKWLMQRVCLMGLLSYSINWHWPNCCLRSLSMSMRRKPKTSIHLPNILALMCYSYTMKLLYKHVKASSLLVRRCKRLRCAFCDCWRFALCLSMKCWLITMAIIWPLSQQQSRFQMLWRMKPQPH